VAPNPVVAPVGAASPVFAAPVVAALVAPVGAAFLVVAAVVALVVVALSRPSLLLLFLLFVVAEL
jgi:hypothetical protein